ncbi:MAG: Tim44 domain-containing protein [Oscillospiraceae bacterium]|nr:Tim44 domain-containing protein [Oscillospiraceae bacterium]
MKRFQKILLILLAVFTVLPCAGMLVQKHALSIRADFGDFGGGDDYGGGGGGGGGGDYDGDSGSGTIAFLAPVFHVVLPICICAAVGFLIFLLIYKYVTMQSFLEKYLNIRESGDKGAFIIFILPLLTIALALALSIVETMVSLIVLALFSLPKLIKKKKQRGGSGSAGMGRLTELQRMQQTEEQIAKVIPGYSAESMKQWVTGVYIALQNAWQAKDLSSVRPYLSATAFRQYQTQLENYRQRQETNIISGISVKNVRAVRASQELSNDLLTVTVEAEITDYVTDDRTGKVVRGNPKARKRMTYEWTLMRSHGPLHGAVSCPCCGMQVDINQAAQCPGCGNMIVSGRFNWVISNIKGLSQKTL